MTEAERLAHRERVKAMQRQRDDDLEQRQQLAAADALKRWTAATPGTQHDYLTRKGIQPHGASIHECTGHAVAVAFNAGNLEAVAVALRSKYPALKIIIAADDDHQTPGNPGMTKATAAVHATGGTLAVPVFKAVAA